MADGYDGNPHDGFRLRRSYRPSTKRPLRPTKVRLSKVDRKKLVANRTKGNNRGILRWGNPLLYEQEEEWVRWRQQRVIAANYNHDDEDDDDDDDDDACTCDRLRACICCVCA